MDAMYVLKRRASERGVNLNATPDAAIESAPAGEHIPVLDGLRGVAIILVFLVHAISIPLRSAATRADEAVRVITSVGWTGVDLFFVLSGFLITGILLDTQGQPRWWPNFIARRALRIFPLYYGTLVILFVLLPQVVRWSAIPGFTELQASQRWYWTYTVNLLLSVTSDESIVRTTHFWSLSIEEQFYLLWPLIVWMCKPQGLLRVVVFTVVGGVAFRLGLLLSDPANGTLLAAFLTPGRLDGLMIGAAIAVIARGPGGLARFKAVAPWVLGAGVIAIGALAMLKGGLGHRDPVVLVVGLPVIALAYGGLLIWALTGPPTSRLVRALTNVSLRKWGKYSYAIYVIHWPLLGVIAWKTPFYQYDVTVLGGSRLPIVLLLAAVAMSLTYMLAWLSYHVYEKRFLDLKGYFGRRPLSQTIPARAVLAGPEPHLDRVTQRVKIFLH